MSASATSSGLAPAPNSLHALFLSILPRIERHGRCYFRHVRCPDRKEELLAEMRGLCWKWFVRLVRRGKQVMTFISALASYAARAVRSGRRLCGHERAKEVLSPVAQRKGGFRVEPLPRSTRSPHEHLYATPHAQALQDAFEERLRDNAVTPPPDAAAFRVDWPHFLGGLTRRDRAMALFLSLGHSGKATAARFGLSPGRVTQLRQQWCREWRLCQGEGEAVPAGAARPKRRDQP